MKVNIERVITLKAELLKINQEKFENIEWYKNGKLLKFIPEEIAWFKFTGLNNTDLVTGKYGIRRLT